MDESTRDILIWGSIAVWWFIFSPIAIYYLFLYYRVRNIMSIRQRRYQIVIVYTSICIYLWLIDRPLSLLWISQIFGKSLILHIIHFISFPFAFHGILWCLIWRYWMVYYDIQFVSNTYNSKWKTIINTTDDDKNWFLNNMQTFGNLKWVKDRLLLIYLPIISISSIIQILPWFHYYTQTMASLLDGALAILSGICFLFIYKKTPPFKDNFFIKLELKFILYIYGFEWMLIFVVRGLNLLIKLDIVLLVILQSWTAVITTAFWTYLCTLWILRKCVNDLNENMSSRSSSSITTQLSSMISISHNASQSKSRISVASKIQLFQILNNNDGFELFMSHLLSEFSHECLISFIEMVQFKKLLHSNIDNNNNDDMEDMNDIENEENKNKILLFDFPECVPISSIISKKEKSMIMLSNDEDIGYKYKTKAFKIFQRYIYGDNVVCEYEINISYHIRLQLIKIMGDYNKWINNDCNIQTLYHLFDKSIISMYQLMQDSFKRFKKTAEFEKFHKYHFAKQS